MWGKSVELAYEARPPIAAPKALPSPRPLSERPLSHLLIVAGARGAGKTTLIDQLARDELQDDIRALLPTGAARWPAIGAVKHDRWLPQIIASTAASWQVPNITLHYDMLRLTYFFSEEHDPVSDPALGFCGHARSITVVTVRADHVRILRQYHMREGGRSMKHLLRRSLLRAAMNASDAMKPALLKSAKPLWKYDRHFRSLTKQIFTHYTDRQFVDDLYRTWDATARRACAGTPLRMIEIEPKAWADEPCEVEWTIRSVSDFAA